MKIEIVTIGDELLLGFTVDTNSAHLARELATIGVEITHRASVGDNASDIAEAVKAALDRTGAVITTGGLGPTADDLTKPSIARLFGKGMYRDEEIVDSMKARWARLKRTGPFPESNIAQAMIPDGATILPNRHGSAPGIWLEDEKGHWVAMLPGVPREMRGLLADELLPKIRMLVESESHGEAPVIKSRTLRTTGIAESALADQLGELAAGVDGMGLAFLPSVDSVDLRVTARGVPAAEADAMLDRAVVKLRSAAGRYVYGEEGADLAEVVLAACRKRGVRLAVAESCTGGMLGSRITAIPGSSDVFLGGVIAYDNAVKREVLGVSDSDLEEHGAVSEEVASAMAGAVRRMLKADIGIGITGVAGPGGGTAAKPVGMVWVAIDGPRAEARCLRLFGTREEVRQRAAQAALDMIRHALSTS
ncbi:MAG TPA: competence/damage-inducible protein A [Gemmatimonadaceae bacterium]